MQDIIKQGEQDYYNNVKCPYDPNTKEYDMWWQGWNNSDDEASASFKDDPLAQSSV